MSGRCEVCVANENLKTTGGVERLGKWWSSRSIPGEKSSFQLTLASFSAASYQAPYARQTETQLFVRGDEQSMIDELDLEPVSERSNVRIMSPYDDGVFYGSEDSPIGVPMTGPIQTYLDLIWSQERGLDAAEQILEKIMIPAWKKADLHV